MKTNLWYVGKHQEKGERIVDSRLVKDLLATGDYVLELPRIKKAKVRYGNS